MENNNWAKTLLTSYKYFEKVAGAIDKLVSTKAVGSAYLTKSYLMFNSCEKLAEEIIELNEKKINIINAKILCENILLAMKRSEARLLIKFYIEQKKGEEVMKELGIKSVRSYFRYKVEALTNFSKALARNGYTSLVLKNKYFSHGWIYKTYNEISGGNEENKLRCLSDYFASKTFITRLSGEYSRSMI